MLGQVHLYNRVYTRIDLDVRLMEKKCEKHTGAVFVSSTVDLHDPLNDMVDWLPDIIE